MNRLDGRVVIVTGGASGIGKAACLAFSQVGASVIVADRNLEGAAAVADGAGTSASALWFDALEEATVQALVDEVIAKHGRLDVVHNNAALAFDDDTTVIDTDLATWDRTFALNVRGYVAMCKSALPRIIESGGGAIINTASAAGLAGGIVHSAYGASKAAVIALSRFIATQYGPDGVRCNAIAPGPIWTPGLEHSAGSAELIPLAVRQLLVGRLGTPEDVARLAVFLASDDASFITGQVVSCDGGMLAHQPYIADLRDAGAS
jgi:NAD(P)-dependent dehydrogenase (short-subunit alcohol dehydrogenase family)